MTTRINLPSSNTPRDWNMISGYLPFQSVNLIIKGLNSQNQPCRTATFDLGSSEDDDDDLFDEPMPVIQIRYRNKILRLNAQVWDLLRNDNERKVAFSISTPPGHTRSCHIRAEIDPIQTPDWDAQESGDTIIIYDLSIVVEKDTGDLVPPSLVNEGDHHRIHPPQGEPSATPVTSSEPSASNTGNFVGENTPLFPTFDIYLPPELSALQVSYDAMGIPTNTLQEDMPATKEASGLFGGDFNLDDMEWLNDINIVQLHDQAPESLELGCIPTPTAPIGEEPKAQNDIHDLTSSATPAPDPSDDQVPSSRARDLVPQTVQVPPDPRSYQPYQKTPWPEDNPGLQPSRKTVSASEFEVRQRLMHSQGVGNKMNDYPPFPQNQMSAMGVGNVPQGPQGHPTTYMTTPNSMVNGNVYHQQQQYHPPRTGPVQHHFNPQFQQAGQHHRNSVLNGYPGSHGLVPAGPSGMSRSTSTGHPSISRLMGPGVPPHAHAPPSVYAGSPGIGLAPSLPTHTKHAYIPSISAHSRSGSGTPVQTGGSGNAPAGWEKKRRHQDTEEEDGIEVQPPAKARKTRPATSASSANRTGPQATAGTGTSRKKKPETLAPGEQCHDWSIS